MEEDGERCRSERLAFGGDEHVVVVRGKAPLDDRDREALAQLAGATIEHLNRTDPTWAIRQDLVRAERLARRCIPDGPVTIGSRELDGREVRVALTSAVRAVVQALRAATATAADGS